MTDEKLTQWQQDVLYYAYGIAHRVLTDRETSTLFTRISLHDDMQDIRAQIETVIRGG
jgi:hypothetical protein